MRGTLCPEPVLALNRRLKTLPAGAQLVRTAAMIQLLFGNQSVAGGATLHHLRPASSDWPRTRISQALGDGARGCRLDPAGLD